MKSLANILMMWHSRLAKFQLEAKGMGALSLSAQTVLDRHKTV